MWFLRHPTPDVETGTCYGRTDLDIAEVGPEQIANAVKTTPPVKRIFASPALRCRQLANSLAERDSLSISFDERLWEMHMGDWENIKWADIDRGLSNQWLSDPINNPTPNGESFSQLQSRVLAAIDEIGYDNETAIVCHAGPIRAMQMAWEGLSFKDAFASTPPYAEPVKIQKP